MLWVHLLYSKIVKIRHCNYDLVAPQYEASTSDTAREVASAERVPYGALTELLEQPESERIALYIPEEWLPNDTAPEYREAFLDAWWRLLKEVDQRADFVDGDIGEANDEIVPPLVVKAAHLSRMLGRAGLVSRADIAYISRETDSELLRQSFADADTPPIARILPTPHNYQREYLKVVRSIEREDISTARKTWKHESQATLLIRDVARDMDMHDIDKMLRLDDAISARIAVAALTLSSRHGTDISRYYPWMTHQLAHEDMFVRRQAVNGFRHLYESGRFSAEELAERQVSLPVLTGDISRNLDYMDEEVRQACSLVDSIRGNEELAKMFYPIAIIGGSKLKGYGDEYSDTDCALIARPSAVIDFSMLTHLSEQDRPVVIETTEDNGLLKVDAVYANMIYSAAWIGDSKDVESLQRSLDGMLTNPEYRRFTLRRLEQDALQYRLLHKGYERHHAVVADDKDVLTDGIDSQSVFWDPGYRRLATQIFAERVVLPGQ